MANNTNIFFLIRSLELGGAERQLALLARGLQERGHWVVVVVFYHGGPYQKELQQAGVRVLSLEKRGRWDIPGFLWRYSRALKLSRPTVLHAYLGMPNILSLLARLFVPGVRIVWGLRASNMDMKRYDWLQRLSWWIECRLSRYADLIIVNSHAGMAFAEANGFPREKMRVIANGIDVERFRCDRAAGQAVRRQLGISEDAVVIGLVGRLDPMKGYPVLLQAAALLARNRDWQQVRFVIVGSGPEGYRQRLFALTALQGLDDRIIWAGARTDLPAVYSSFDIFTSASVFGEGFPNVIGEAMACGLPCVVTDVGDAARIVGDLGIVVPPDDARALVDAWQRILSGDFKPNPARIRARIAEQFSVQTLVEKTEAVLFENGVK